MTTVLVGGPDGAGPAVPLIELSPGQVAYFGRNCPGEPVDVPLPDPAVSRLAGRIRAVEDHWTISNLSPNSTYVVMNPEGGGEFVKVAPRRLEMPVPFEFARVVLAGLAGEVSFPVYAPQHTFAESGAAPDRSGGRTVMAFPLDETAKYFLVLVALCEPALRTSGSVVVPAAAQIVRRLVPLPSCRDLTVAAVHFHIDYLASRKLRVKERELPPGGDRRDWQRAALVSVALRFDLVREEHLALLPGRRPGAARPAAQDGGGVVGRGSAGS